MTKQKAQLLQCLDVRILFYFIHIFKRIDVTIYITGLFFLDRTSKFDDN